LINFKVGNGSLYKKQRRKRGRGVRPAYLAAFPPTKEGSDKLLTLPARSIKNEGGMPILDL